jgi:16S rRNA (adenine1518-N6/adenine1519-N6)-dimethyltransferase
MSRRATGRGRRERRESRRAPPRRRKRFGQHFLTPAWAQRVVSAIAPEPGDAFLEVGAGRGEITLPLAATGAPVLAIEIDRDLAADLARRAPSNVTILADDVMKADVLPLLRGLTPQRPPAPEAEASSMKRVRVVGNLPYYIASPILFRLLELHQAHAGLFDATVMVQREVASRLVARPGTKDYGVLTILLALRARISRVLELPQGAFTPAPKVQSTLVRLEFIPPVVRLPDERLFERMVKGLFSRRRKTLANALKAFDPLAPAVLAIAGFDARRRPETLTLAELGRIAELLAVLRRPAVL